MTNDTKRKVPNYILVACLVSTVVLAVIDMFYDENIPFAVYGIIGGIAFGADSESIRDWWGKR